MRMDEAELRRRVGPRRASRGWRRSRTTGAPISCRSASRSRGERLFNAVDGKPKRSRDLRRLRNLRARPWATVLVYHYEEDWTRLWWARLRGLAEVLEDGDAARRALALLIAKYPQYERDPPAGPVVAMRLAEWHGWSAQDGSAP